METKVKRMQGIVMAIVVIQLVALLVMQFIFQQKVLFGYLLVGIEAILCYFIIHYLEYDMHARATGIDRLIASEYKGALTFGEIGILTYDENYTIDSQSELFLERGLDRVGKKLLAWLPEVDDLISGKEDAVEVVIDDHSYQITRKEEGPVLFFKDVTTQNQYKQRASDEQLVLGMIHLDNYEESTQYEDEQVVSNINNSIRQPVVDWCKEHGLVIRRVKNDRYFAVLNEKTFNELVEDRFSILNTVRKASSQLDVPITLSLAFARGGESFQELDETVIDLLDLAQTRGGDQVAIRKVGDEVKYFGGSSEAQEKRSKVRVRIISNTLRDLIQKSGNVIVCCHKDADFDCMGSAIAMSRIVQAYNTPCSIIAKTGGMDEQLNVVINANIEELKGRHQFVSENEALNQLTDDTLVIVVDHHSAAQSNGTAVLEKAKQIVIIDHHRRGAEMDITPVLVYVEAGASSTCELVSEFVPYLTNKVDISPLEATIMFTGLLIDTHRFRARTGTRTFDAAAMMRKWNADPLMADSFLKDSFAQFDLKTKIMNQAQEYEHGIIIATEKDQSISRTMMSQVADSLLQIQKVEAAFVIANTGDGQTAISARSNGSINVQVIMEKMKGGGHRTGAGVQRKDTTVDELKNELILKLKEYFEEEQPTDESNPVE